MLIVVKNIKAFDPSILNALVHNVHKYRGDPWRINFSLMLGVQNNSKDELHIRVNIKNCIKLSVKQFWFPSMKNILFEVVYKLLFSLESVFAFDPSCVQVVVEQLNLYGMSALKFSRLLRLLITQKVFAQKELFLLHTTQPLLRLCTT